MLVNAIIALICYLWIIDNVTAATLRGQPALDAVFHAPPAEAASEELLSNSIPSICLEDPEHPDCDGLHYFSQYYGPNNNYYYNVRDTRPEPSRAPTVHYRQATASPTRDMCYGNMKLHHYGKFCHSEMPSVSTEPSEQPTVFSTGEVGRGTSVPSFQPSDFPAPTQFPSESPSYHPSYSPTRRPSESPSAHPSPSPSETPSFRPSVRSSESPSESPSTSPTSKNPSEQPSHQPTIDLVINMTQPPTKRGEEDDDIIHNDDPDSEDIDDSESPTTSPTRTSMPSVSPTTSAPSLPEGDQFSYDENGDGRLDDEHDNTLPYRPDFNPDAFRLKLYWQQGYYWQEETFERKWCMRCINNLHCREGESLFLGDCAFWQKSAYFDFIYHGNNIVTIEVMSENNSGVLCLERGGGSSRQVTLRQCEPNNSKQKWKASQGSFTGDSFEVSQTIHGVEYCLTNHHHPKYGERLELYTCAEARADDTSFWNIH
jgi:hypothetical protein